MSTAPVTEPTTITLPAVADKRGTSPALATPDGMRFELLQREARLMASSSLVPKEYQGNLANCYIAANLANRMGADLLMVMQNLYVVHGRPGWSAQFLIATFNQNGRFTALRYEFLGEPGQDSYGCRAWAVEKETGQKLVGADLSVALAKREGWFDKAGSKWKTMPQQMLMYRAAAWFIRAYAPEIAMGLQTAEELVDVPPEQLRQAEALTDEQRRERGEMLASIAQQKIAFPDRHAKALTFLGFDDNQRPDSLPFETLRALVALLEEQARYVAPETAEPVAEQAAGQGALLETPTVVGKKGGRS